MKSERWKERCWQMMSEHKCFSMLMEWGCDSYSALMVMRTHRESAPWGQRNLKPLAVHKGWSIAIMVWSAGRKAGHRQQRHLLVRKTSPWHWFWFVSLWTLKESKAICSSQLGQVEGWRKVTGAQRGADSFPSLPKSNERNIESCFQISSTQSIAAHNHCLRNGQVLCPQPPAVRSSTSNWDYLSSLPWSQRARKRGREARL